MQEYKHSMRAGERKSAGFTVVELMVATMIFSVVLLIVTEGVIQFSRAYYKGAITAKTQDVTRTVLDSISQSVQFGVSKPQDSNNTAGTSMDFLCAGGNKFMFTPGVQYSASEPSLVNAGVYMVPSIGVCDAPVSPLPTNGTQFLNERMRITQLSMAEIADNLYTISVTVAYGDNDLFCDIKDGASCASTAPTLTNANLAALGSDVRCRGQSGSEFCAVSSLTTTVRKRIQ